MKHLKKAKRHIGRNVCDYNDKHEVNSGGAQGVMLIVVGNGHGDTSSNPGRD